MRVKYLIKPTIISLVIAVSYVSIFSHFYFFKTASLKAQDLFTRIKYVIQPTPKAVNDIVIITIDNRSYDWFGRKWPLPRTVYANLIYKLIKYNPNIIAFNLEFIGKSLREEEDELLQRAFKDADNVYITGQYTNDNLNNIFEPFVDVLAGTGFINTIPDTDSTIRNFELFISKDTDKTPCYSFEFLIACDFMDIPVNPEAIQEKGVKLSNILPINYKARQNDFTTISILDVLQDKYSPETFSNKIVLIGITKDPFSSIKATPLGPMPNLLVTANKIVMLLCKSFVRRIPYPVSFLMLILFSTAIGTLSYKANFIRGFDYLLLLLAVFLLLSLIFAVLNFTWDFFGIPFVMVCIFIIINFNKFADYIIEPRSIKKQLALDNPTGLPSRHYLLLKLDKNLEDAKKKNNDLSLVLFRINNYELLKSSFGTKGTKRILHQTADLLSNRSRGTKHLDFVSRYSENEFCAVLYSTSSEGAKIYAKRMQTLLEKERFLGRKKANISIKTGIAAYSVFKPETTEDFVQYAEKDLNSE